MSNKVVLGFSGGLDTSYCALWLREQGYDPICVLVDVGQGVDVDRAKKRALTLGVGDLVVVDAREDFANYFLAPAIRANARYQSVYPLATALSRPMIGRVLSEVALERGAKVVAHGCTGKGNDQARFELALIALIPDVEILRPIADEGLSREDEAAFLRERGFDPGPTGSANYSIDENLWGRSVCAGALEELHEAVPDNVYDWTASIEECPSDATSVALDFEAGTPTALNGESLPLAELIRELNVLGGAQGIGRIDHLEDRLVGIKSREIYEAPAATIALVAHERLESATLTRSSLKFKKALEQEYAEVIYKGEWYSRHHFDLLAYLEHNQRSVAGRVDMSLDRGNVIVTGTRPNRSLYDRRLATYSRDSTFDQSAAAGYLKVLTNETRTVTRQGLLVLSNEDPPARLIPPERANERSEA